MGINFIKGSLLIGAVAVNIILEDGQIFKHKSYLIN